MFCVIQKVVNKKPNEHGERKELLADSYSFNLGDGVKTKYTYKYSDERFERPIRDAYKISIHHSYRENGKVKKKQWSICTMSYYALLEYGPSDCTNVPILREKLTEMGITEEELWNMVYDKLDPIVEAAKKEHECTEEYQAYKTHNEIISKYQESKKTFEDKYGSDTYDYCYDVFGELRNPEYLSHLEQHYNAQQEYKERSYYSYEQSNYNYYESSGYSSNKLNTYTDDDKAKLKKIFKTLAMEYHPDITKDDGEMMKFINRLKDGWGI